MGCAGKLARQVPSAYEKDFKNNMVEVKKSAQDIYSP